jgi:hypothetical protein
MCIDSQHALANYACKRGDNGLDVPEPAFAHQVASGG